MSSLYYVGVGVVSLSMSIYNFNTIGKSNNQTCYVNKSMTYNECIDYYNSIGQELECYNESYTESKVPYSGKRDISVQESNPYKTFCLLVGIIYIILLAMSLFLACITNYLSNQLPDDYINMGTCKKFLACFCKILPPCFILLSWLNLIFFIVVWIFILQNKCHYSTTMTPGKLISTDYFFKVHRTLNIVNSFVWIFLHYGGAIIRGMTYVEPFMYSPEVGNPNFFKTLMLKRLGP